MSKMLIHRLKNSICELNKNNEDALNLINQIAEFLEKGSSHKIEEVLSNETRKNGKINPKNSYAMNIWNFPGFYYLRSGKLSDAKNIYYSFYKTLLKRQQDDNIRYHKGLPLHNVGVSIEPFNVHEAVRYYKLAYIEDIITNRKASFGAPAHKALKYRFNLDYDELIGIYEAAIQIKDNKNPENILKEFESNSINWIKFGLTREYFVIDLNYYSLLLDRIEPANTNQEKKDSLEKLTEYLFSSIQGFEVRPSTRTSTSELDRIIRNTSLHPDLRILGDYIPIECKNWKDPVGANEIRDFVGKLRNSRCSTGIIISKKGITGDPAFLRDAKGEIRNTFQKDGIVIIVMPLKNLKAIQDGKNLIELILEIYEKVRFM